MAGKFEIYRDERGEHRFRLTAANGESILVSEAYSAPSGCANGIASVQRNCVNDGRYDVQQAKNGKYYFTLRSGNHQVVGTSQLYGDEASLKRGMESVKRNGTTDRIEAAK